MHPSPSNQLAAPNLQPIPEALIADAMATPLGAIALNAKTDDQRYSAETVDTGSPLHWEVIEGLNYLPGNKLITELPASAFGTRKTSEGQQPDRISILPTAFEALAPGDYRISDKQDNVTVRIVHTNDGVFFSMRPTRNPLNEQDNATTLEAQLHEAISADTARFQAPFVSANEGESYLSDATFYYRQLTYYEEERPLTLEVLHHFGYPEETIDGIKTILVPTPQTLKKLAQQHGVALELIDETLDGTRKISYNAVPAKKYDAAFAEGKYPVGTRDIGYYGHDTEAGHFPALLFGGAEFMALLAPRVKTALAAGISVTEYLDSMTNYITDAMYAASNGGDLAASLFYAESNFMRISSDVYEDESDKYALRKLFAKKFRALVNGGTLKGEAANRVSKLEAFITESEAA